VDQLLDQHGLADARATEQPDLAALDVRGDQVDDLEAGLEDLDLRGEVAEGRRVAVDRPALGVRGELGLPVDRLPDHVPEPAQRRLPDRHGDRLAGVDHLDPASEPVGRVHRNRAHAVVAQVLLHLGHERAAFPLDLERAQDLREALGEHGVDHDALDLDDPAGVDAVALCHGSLGLLRCERWARTGPQRTGPKPARV
jgi:peptide chain release factor 1